MRKSLKIAPGVRLNVSTRGVGVSAGVRGARYSVHSSGRRTTSLSVPGTGIGWTSSSGGSRRSGARSPAASRTSPLAEAPTAITLPSPGRLDPKGYRALFEAVQRGLQDPKSFEEVALRHPDVATAASLLAGIAYLGAGDRPKAASLLERVVGDPADVADHPFVTKYLEPRGVSVETSVAAGVMATLPVGREAATLTLAELRQAMGDPHAAISLVEDLPPSTIAAVSLAELYVQTEQYNEVLELTNGLKNEDEASALLLVFRGSALRALGHHDAAVEALKEALRARSRPAPIRHLALVQRAEAYRALGQRAAARKDLERVLADDASFPGLTERLEALQAGAATEHDTAEEATRPKPRPAQRDSALDERDWRREVEAALGRLAPHMKGATEPQKGALREALAPGQIPIAVAFGSAKMDGKSLGFMPVPVWLTSIDVMVVAKEGVQRLPVAALSSVDVGGSRLGGGSLTMTGTRMLEVTGIRPYEAAAAFAAHLPVTESAAAPSVLPTTAASTTPPEWYPDPTGRHHYRYWDGSVWTEDVATDGVVTTDPLPPEGG